MFGPIQWVIEVVGRLRNQNNVILGFLTMGRWKSENKQWEYHWSTWRFAQTRQTHSKIEIHVRYIEFERFATRKHSCFEHGMCKLIRPAVGFGNRSQNWRWEKWGQKSYSPTFSGRGGAILMPLGSLGVTVIGSPQVLHRPLGQFGILHWKEECSIIYQTESSIFNSLFKWHRSFANRERYSWTNPGASQ